MSERRSILEDRIIEYDGLAIVMFALAFAGLATAVALLVAGATQALDAKTIAAGAIVAAGVIGAWIAGYPRRAAIPMMSLVMLCAILILPAVFDMDGMLLREAAGTPVSHLYVAMGLYISGLGFAFLAFIVFGFFCPLAGALLAVRRGEPGARQTLMLHGVLCVIALALTLIPLVWL